LFRAAGEEALTGYHLTIEHLDGQKLAVSSRPGEIVRPRNLLLSAEAEWERFDHTDAFPGEDAGSMKAHDLEACKEVCRQRGFCGFTYWEDTAYFRAHSRTEVLAARVSTRGATLFVSPDPAKSASVRTQRTIRGAGMPCSKHPSIRGNLVVLLKVEFPQWLDDQAVKLLQDVLPADGTCLTPDGDSGDVEEAELCDLDPVESARQNHMKTGGASFTHHETDEAPPTSARLPPCRQM